MRSFFTFAKQVLFNSYSYMSRDKKAGYVFDGTELFTAINKDKDWLEKIKQCQIKLETPYVPLQHEVIGLEAKRKKLQAEKSKIHKKINQFCEVFLTVKDENEPFPIEVPTSKTKTKTTLQIIEKLIEYKPKIEKIDEQIKTSKPRPTALNLTELRAMLYFKTGWFLLAAIILIPTVTWFLLLLSKVEKMSHHEVNGLIAIMIALIVVGYIASWPFFYHTETLRSTWGRYKKFKNLSAELLPNSLEEVRVVSERTPFIFQNTSTYGADDNDTPAIRMHKLEKYKSSPYY